MGGTGGEAQSKLMSPWSKLPRSLGTAGWEVLLTAPVTHSPQRGVPEQVPICPGLFSLPWPSPRYLSAHPEICACSQVNFEKLGGRDRAQSESSEHALDSALWVPGRVRALGSYGGLSLEDSSYSEPTGFSV